jgi:hypothetical protein
MSVMMGQRLGSLQQVSGTARLLAIRHPAIDESGGVFKDG